MKYNNNNNYPVATYAKKIIQLSKKTAQVHHKARINFCPEDMTYAAISSVKSVHTIVIYTDIYLYVLYMILEGSGPLSSK